MKYPYFSVMSSQSELPSVPYIVTESKGIPGEERVLLAVLD
jgi:hypothetical protein